VRENDHVLSMQNIFTIIIKKYVTIKHAMHNMPYSSMSSCMDILPPCVYYVISVQLCPHTLRCKNRGAHSSALK